MSDFHLLHLAIVNAATVDFEELRNRMELADDWFQYSATNFLIWSKNPSQVWSHVLRNNGGLDKAAFILYTVDPKERQGWMPNELWEWLDKLAPAGPRRRQLDPLADMLGVRNEAGTTKRRQLSGLEELLGIQPKPTTMKDIIRDSIANRKKKS